MPPWGSLVTLNNVSLSDPYSTYPGGNPVPAARSARNATFPLNGTYWTQQLEGGDAAHAALQRSVQKQFGDNLAVTASYFGNRSSHIWLGMEINPARLHGRRHGGEHQSAPRRSTCRTRTRGRYFASVTQLNMDGRRSYNGC